MSGRRQAGNRACGIRRSDFQGLLRKLTGRYSKARDSEPTRFERIMISVSSNVQIHQANQAKRRQTSLKILCAGAAYSVGPADTVQDSMARLTSSLLQTRLPSYITDKLKTENEM